MNEREEARIQLRWRAGHLDSVTAIGDRWGQPAPDWYWLDPVPVLPLPGSQTPAPWGTGIPEFHDHEPRELRLFWPRSAVHLVREAVGRYRWVELAEPAQTGTSPPPPSEGWQTVAVSCRRQPVLLRQAIPAGGHFEILHYMAENRVLFWRLGWNPAAPAAGPGDRPPSPGDIPNTTDGD
jgi:hypothetical protein